MALNRYNAALAPFLDALETVADPTSPEFEALLPDAEGYLVALALCHNSSRDAADPRAVNCANAALALADRIIRDHAAGVRAFGDGVGSVTPETVASVVLAYDWLHDRLTPAQRHGYARLAVDWVDWYRASVPGSSTPYTAAYATYLYGLALTVVATAGESADGDRLTARLNEALQWELPVLNQRLCGGDFPEGVESAPLAIQHFQLVNQLLRDNAVDHSVVFDWIENVAIWMSYRMSPDFAMTIPFGDATGPTPHRTSPALLAILSSTTASGPHAARLYVNGLAAPGNDFRDPSPGFAAWELLFAQTDVIGDVTVLPLSYLASGTGRWVSRSSFTDPDAYQVTAEVMGYRGDGFGYSNGDVRLYRGSECLVCPSVYRGPAFRGSDSTAGFSTYLLNQRPQGELARNAQAVALRTTPEYSAITLRFASSYAPGEYDEDVLAEAGPLYYLVREVVHLYPDTLIVRDMHFRRHPSDTMTALWHIASTGDPVVEDAHHLLIPTASETLRVSSFTDQVEGMPAESVLETDFDAAGNRIGTLIRERYLTDGSVRFPPDGLVEEYVTAHVFTQSPDRVAASFTGSLGFGGAVWGLQFTSGSCLTFERGGAITFMPCP